MSEFFPNNYPDFSSEGTPPCATADPEAFFPVTHSDGMVTHREYYEYEREAKQICFSCPYRLACLEYALDNPEEIGIWGGTTGRQRTYMRKLPRTELGLPTRR